jgi:hypothetical protein
MPINSGPGGQRRLIFTGNVKTNLFNKYTPGSGVGALSTSVRRRLKRSASSSQGSMNAQGKYIHGNRCCSAELQSKTRTDNVAINQSLVLGNEFSQYVNSMNSTELLDTAHTATQATNNLVFGLRNSSVKFTSPIMKQEAIGFTSQCYNVGSDLNVDVQLSVSHDGQSNPNHTAEIQHDKAIAFIINHISNYIHNGKLLSEYGIAITGNVDSDYEYGWKITMKNVNIAPIVSFNIRQRVTIQVFVSNENDAGTPGPVYAIASLNGYSPLSIDPVGGLVDGNALLLNNGNGYDKGDDSTDTFDIVSNSDYFYITISMGTDNGINIKKVIITYNNHTNIFECNDEYYNPPDNTVGWIDADSIGEHPNNRYYTIYYDGSTTTPCD